MDRSFASKTFMWMVSWLNRNSFWSTTAIIGTAIQMCFQQKASIVSTRKHLAIYIKRQLHEWTSYETRVIESSTFGSPSFDFTSEAYWKICLYTNIFEIKCV